MPVLNYSTIPCQVVLSCVIKSILLFNYYSIFLAILTMCNIELLSIHHGFFSIFKHTGRYCAKKLILKCEIFRMFCILLINLCKHCTVFGCDELIFFASNFHFSLPFRHFFALYSKEVSISLVSALAILGQFCTVPVLVTV